MRALIQTGITAFALVPVAAFGFWFGDDCDDYREARTVYNTALTMARRAPSDGANDAMVAAYTDVIESAEDVVDDASSTARQLAEVAKEKRDAAWRTVEESDRIRARLAKDRPLGRGSQRRHKGRCCRGSGCLRRRGCGCRGH